MVSSLFCVNIKEWDEDLVRDVNERDVVIILGIYLSSSNLEDSWYWSNETSGIYLVKNGYRWLLSLKMVARTDDNSGFWKKLWHLKVPPKNKGHNMKSCNALSTY